MPAPSGWWPSPRVRASREPASAFLAFPCPSEREAGNAYPQTRRVGRHAVPRLPNRSEADGAARTIFAEDIVTSGVVLQARRRGATGRFLLARTAVPCGYCAPMEFRRSIGGTEPAADRSV